MECCTTTCVLGVWLVLVLYKLLDWIIRIPRVSGLSDRRVLVTGCDTGFGHEIAKRLDKLGVQVFAACLTDKGETELKKACSSRLTTVHMDVSDPDSVSRAYDSVAKLIPKGQGLWGVLNNAGIAGKIGPVEWLRLDDYRHVTNINLLGLIDVTVNFLPLIKKARGRIVNTASVGGRVSLAGMSPYCVSKYGVECFSDAIRRQLRDWGITVHLIEPGFHKTNITNPDGLARQLRQSWDQCSPDIQAEYGEHFLTQSIDVVLKNFVGGIVSERITDVVDVYEHALIGRFPRARYLVGKDAKLVWLPLNSLPEWLGDWLLSKLASDPPKPAALRAK